MPVREDRAEPAYGIFFTFVVLKKSYAGKFKIFYKFFIKKIKKQPFFFLITLKKTIFLINIFLWKLYVEQKLFKS